MKCKLLPLNLTAAGARENVYVFKATEQLLGEMFARSSAQSINWHFRAETDGQISFMKRRNWHSLGRTDECPEARLQQVSQKLFRLMKKCAEFYLPAKKVQSMGNAQGSHEPHGTFFVLAFCCCRKKRWICRKMNKKRLNGYWSCAVNGSFVQHSGFMFHPKFMLSHRLDCLWTLNGYQILCSIVGGAFFMAPVAN